MSETVSSALPCLGEPDVPVIQETDCLHALLDDILAGVLLVDRGTHRIVDVNPHAAELIGLPRGQIVGRVCHQFICPAVAGSCPFCDLGQTVDRSEDFLLRADGRRVAILKTVVASTWQGHDCLIESFVDISALKQVQEELRRTNEELSHFAYVVSHDLKAPLRGIQLIAEWLCEDYGNRLGPEGQEQLTLLQSRVHRMHNLIDGVLQYSRIGRFEEEIGPVNLQELLPVILDTLAPPPHIRITVEGELPTVVCGTTRITQVFQNLLSNAIKYLDKPQGEIRVGGADRGAQWEFYVADNGPGIEAKHFERIFRIFQTLSPKDEHESTGIGLTVVKKIVELYGGRVWVESEVGRGSTFLFTLPKEHGSQGPLGRAAADSGAPAGRIVEK